MRTQCNLPIRTLPTWYDIYEFGAPPYSTRTWSAPKPGECNFGVMLAGHAELEWEHLGTRQRMTTRPGDVVFYQPGFNHWERNLEQPRVRTCWIHVGWTAPTPPLPSRVHDEHGLLEILAFEMLGVYVGELPPAAKQRLLNAFFVAFVAEYQRLGADHPSRLAETLRLYVKEHMIEPCRVAHLARHVGVGRNQLGRSYKAATGRTPKAEIDSVKAEHARGIFLRVPGIPLKDVAKRVGLGSARQLRRLIRRQYGVPVRDLPRARQPGPTAGRHSGP